MSLTACVVISNHSIKWNNRSKHVVTKNHCHDMCPCFVMSDFIVIILGQVDLKLYYGYWFVHSLLEFGIR